jgi:hypothetical protein
MIRLIIIFIILVFQIHAQLLIQNGDFEFGVLLTRKILLVR